MISISNLSIHYSGHYLFDNVSFNVNNNDRIGLIGRNGTGKTTILKILTGLETPEEGTITKPNDYTIGYLPQEGSFVSEETVYNEVKLALSEIFSVEDKIHSISGKLSEIQDYHSSEYDNLIHELSLANDRFKILGGKSVEADIVKVLKGLGFDDNDMYRKVNEFSGGFVMRVELAKILLRRPDCILLDEPTNHLDIESVQWLENYLMNYYGAVVLVSHDRNFLDNVTNRTIELANAKIYDMDVPYTKFIDFREEQKKHRLAAYKAQQKQIEDTERFVERFRSKATLASRVQSRIKQLEKMDRIELDEEDLSSIKIRFPEPPRSGRLVAEVINLTKRYGEKLVLSNIDFAIERGEKIAFVGKNGEGKSTLTRIFAGMEDYEGDFKTGHNVSTGFFSQNQALLMEGNNTVFDVIDSAATGDMRTRVRSLLGAFLFSGDSVYKKVKVLSGGEKSRLAIAKLLLEPINFLILDEPTNHLDMRAKDVLKNALLDFDGALVLVSHDREFLHGLTNKTIYFSNKKITEFPGDIYDFLERQKLDSLKQLEQNKPAESNSNNKESATGDAQETNISSSKQYRERQKTQQREENRIRRLISVCEDDIALLEDKISSIEHEFSSPEFHADVERAKSRQADYELLRNQLNSKMEHWTDLNIELDELLITFSQP